MATGIPTCRRAGRCRVQHHPSARVGGRHTLAACSPPSPPSHPLLLSHKAPAPHPDPPCLQRNKDLSMVVDKEVSESAAAGLNASVEKAVDGSLDKKTQEKAPKKTHKAEREKLKRDQLNDLFLELGSMLDLDRQNSGKATVLGDAARALRDLVTQVESLRKEHASLLTECQYVTSEKNELREENSVLQTQISELQNELRARVASNSRNLGSFTMSHPIGSNIPNLATHPVPHRMWSNAPNLSTLAMTHPMNSLSLSQHQATEVGQVHLSPPQELQLFPETSASQQHDRSRHRSTPTTSATLTDSLPGQLRLSLPRTAEEELSSGVSGNRKEPKNG